MYGSIWLLTCYVEDHEAIIERDHKNRIALRWSYNCCCFQVTASRTVFGFVTVFVTFLNTCGYLYSLLLGFSAFAMQKVH